MSTNGADLPAEPTSAHVAHGTKVTVFAQAASQVVRLVTNVVLARLLTPKDFGVVAIAMVVTALVEQLKDMGTGSAIIQAKELDHRLINAVFYLNTGLGLVLAGAIIVAAGPLAALLGSPEATHVLMALGAATILSSFGQIHHALIRRALNYRAVAMIAAESALLTALVSVVLAAVGLGVWSLVIGTASGMLLGTGLVWHYDRWRPTRPTHLSAIKPVLGYSINLFLTNLTTYGLNQGSNVIIGRGLGPVALGQFSFAQRTVSAPVGSVTTVAIEVMFPAFSRMQDDDKAVRAGYIRSSRAIALATFPATAGLAALAAPVVHVLLGPRWVGLIPLIWILAPVCAVQSVSATYSELLMAKGRTDLNFRVGIIAGAAVLVAELIGLHWGLIGVTAGFGVVSIVAAPCGLYLAFQKIGMSMRDYVRTLAPTTGASIVMFFAVTAVAHTLGTGLMALVGGLVTGVLVYGSLVFSMRFPAISDLRAVLRAKQA